MNKLKYLKRIDNYIAEQAEGMVDADGNPIAPAPEKDVYAFIFIEEGEGGDYRYPDGSSKKDFKTYEVTEDDLKDWLDRNIDTIGTDKSTSQSAIDVKKKNITDFISGTKSNLTPDDKELLTKFKNNVLSEVIAKPIRDTEVTFSRDKSEMSTDSINVTFIVLPKKR